MHPTVPDLIDLWAPLAHGMARDAARVWRCDWLADCLASSAIDALWRAAEDFVAGFDPAAPRPFPPLARTYIRNAIVTRARRERAGNREGFRAPVTDAEGNDRYAELAVDRAPPVGSEAEFEELLDLLPLRERAAVEARLSGREFDEIGEEMGITKERARQVFARAARRLAPYLTDRPLPAAVAV